jgi:hypothetical protein
MSDNSGKQTEVLHRHILMRPGFEEHPIGHTTKVNRYCTRLGHELAVEKRRGNPVLLVPSSAVRSVPKALAVTTVEAGRTGRNWHLNALSTMRDRPLLRLEVQSIEDADELLRSIG